MARLSALDMPDVPSGLPPHLELQRTRVVCAADAPNYTESLQYSGAYALSGFDNSLRLSDFCKNFRVEIISLDNDDIEFDMIGIDAAIANAFRRILIAEIPTMAIEKVFVANNTSVIQDEVMAHRLGLVPIKVDPRLFDYKSENDLANERNTIVFKLDVVCTRQEGRIKNATVKSEQLQWLPSGSEYQVPSVEKTSKTYTSFSCSQDTLPPFKKDPIISRYPDITLAKLRPGQRRKLAAIGCQNFLKEESEEMSTTCTLGGVCESHILQVNSSDNFSRSSTKDFQSSYLGAIVEAKDASRGQNTALNKSLSQNTSCAKGSSKKRKSVSYKNKLGRKRDATLPSHSKVQSWCKSVSSLDLSNSMTCTPSYRLLPIKYMRQASSLHPLRAQVLNDHWVCVPSDSQNFNLKCTKRNFYEEKLQECEDDRCEVDVLLESTRAAIRRMEVLLKRIDSGEDISLVDNHLTVIDWRCCDRLDDESGLEVKDTIRKDPCTALPVVIDKLKQKQEKLLVSREGFSKSLKEAFLDEDAKSEVKKGSS